MPDERLTNLVNEQYEKLNLANRKISWDMKKMILEESCQEIIYNGWGISSN